MATRLRNSRMRRSRNAKNPGSDRLDKKDEVWCYLLIKLFTSMLENPEEAKMLTKSSERFEPMLEVDLASAVDQLKSAIYKTKSSMSNSTSSGLTKMSRASLACSSVMSHRPAQNVNGSNVRLPRIPSVSSLSSDSSVIDTEGEGDGNNVSGDGGQSKLFELVLKALSGG